ncbi:hypothetical protein BJX66DRAFT_311560 [Aspergillus keveii]|uniref:Uncharacterized protein n=1 Tax=Aspergillus keveii TaxID=714993 RepID=A0ABR4FV75_9EURO
MWQKQSHIDYSQRVSARLLILFMICPWGVPVTCGSVIVLVLCRLRRRACWGKRWKQTTLRPP